MLIKLFRAASLICSDNPHQPFPLHVQVSVFLFLHMHCKENPMYVFIFWELRASVLISTFMCL
jgi:hypothetical protein